MWFLRTQRQLKQENHWFISNVVMAQHLWYVMFDMSLLTLLKGYIRSTLNSTIVVNSVTDLNKTGIIVGAYTGTTYEAYVKTQLTAATYRPFQDQDDQYLALLNKEIHAIVGDAVQSFVWFNNNTKTCAGCSSKAFNDPYSFATFTTRNILSSATMSSYNNWLMLAIAILSIIFMSF